MKRVIFTILLGATAIAYADHESDYRNDIRNIELETKKILGNPGTQDLRLYPVNKCATVVAKAKAAGVAAQATACPPYERAVHIAEAVQLLASVKNGKQCLSEMERLLKFGIGDQEVQIQDIKLKLDDARATVCVPLLSGESVFKDEKELARAAAAVPYEEAGITGAKLKICIANTTNIRLEGGAAATPRDIRRASLLFVLKNPAKDKYELMRIEFKGDEIVKISEKTLNAPPVAADYR